ncbi:hypothetical protein HKD37_02G004065 [Glycine soja]
MIDSSTGVSESNCVEEIKMYYDCRYLSSVSFLCILFGRILSINGPHEKRGFTIGRLHFVPLASGEIFYLRMLLNYVKGPESYAQIRTEACYAMGFLEDDKEYIDAIIETSHWGTTSYLRKLPEYVCNNTWQYLTDDILHRQRTILQFPELKSFAFIDLEKLLQSNNKSLMDFPSMPQPDIDLIGEKGNKLIHDELNYDRKALVVECIHLIGIAALLIHGGRTVHSRFAIPINVDENSTCNIKQGSPLAELIAKSKLIIWDEAPMTQTLTFRDILRFSNESNLNLSFRGKVVVLGGDFCNIPFFINKFKKLTPQSPLPLIFVFFPSPLKTLPFSRSSLNLSQKNDDLGLINRWIVVKFKHQVHNPIQIILTVENFKIIGCHNFCQISPVIPKGKRQEVVHATINSSYLWNFCEVMTFTKNMRLQIGNSDSNVSERKEFSDWILGIGIGTIGHSNDVDINVPIPDDLVLQSKGDSLQFVVNSTYPFFLDNMNVGAFFQDSVILTPRNDIVDLINQYMFLDTPYFVNENNDTPDIVHTAKFFNTITASGLPNLVLKLKVGVLVMLLRNQDQSFGLRNGTRMIVTKLDKYVIEAKVYIPRLSLTPLDVRIPFKFQRRQFPLAISFAMTINKSQGQSLKYA